MSPTIKPKGPFYTITKDGRHIESGSARNGLKRSRLLELGVTVNDVSWHKKIDGNPIAAAQTKVINTEAAKIKIDAEAGVNRATMHANKRIEAERVLFEGEADMNRLPIIAAIIERRNEPVTANEIANEIWVEVLACAEPEPNRTESKRELE